VIKEHRTSPLDICYGLEWPDDREGQRKLVDDTGSLGVTWLLDCVFGLKYSGEQALDRVREGPPDI
jgi:hypothetical protein